MVQTEVKTDVWCPQCGAIGEGIWPVQEADKVRCTGCGYTVTVLYEDEIPIEECKKLGIIFKGMQSGYGIVPDFPMYLDSKCNFTSFSIHKGETLETAVQRVRKMFGVQYE